MVRNLPEDLVRALKQRAARRNHSAEQEHRDILRAALHAPARRSLAEVLATMPNVGKDEDFHRSSTRSTTSPSSISRARPRQSRAARRRPESR